MNAFGQLAICFSALAMALFQTGCATVMLREYAKDLNDIDLDLRNQSADSLGHYIGVKGGKHHFVFKDALKDTQPRYLHLCLPKHRTTGGRYYGTENFKYSSDNMYRRAILFSAYGELEEDFDLHANACSALGLTLSEARGYPPMVRISSGCRGFMNAAFMFIDDKGQRVNTERISLKGYIPYPERNWFLARIAPLGYVITVPFDIVTSPIQGIVLLVHYRTMTHF